MTPDQARAAYAAERTRQVKRQARKTPADPQRTAAAGRDPREVAAELARACECGHPQIVHDTNAAGTRRTYCTIATTAGPCGCGRYTAKMAGMETR